MRRASLATLDLFVKSCGLVGLVGCYSEEEEEEQRSEFSLWIIILEFTSLRD